MLWHVADFVCMPYGLALMNKLPIYLATVCLDPNRWGSREPSFAVSDWLDRIREDGFDGLELWEFHYIKADSDEQQRLIDRRDAITLYNTYANLSSEPEQAQAREAAAGAIEQLQTQGVKFNIGRDPTMLDEYRKNLEAWAARVPDTCRLLCECHPGTPIEEAPAATEFFKDLDPERIGIIAHMASDPTAIDPWMQAFGQQVCHIHFQRRDAGTDPATEAGRDSMNQLVAALKSYDYQGSVTIEFTRGIGRDEQIETVYANALADANAFKEATH